MKIHTISTRDELVSCQQSWNRVADSHCFYSWEWNASWFRNLADRTDQPCVIVGVDHDGRWLGIAPFFVSGRKLRWMGSAAACTDYTNLICAPEHYRPFAEEVAKFLQTATEPGGELESIDLIELEGGAASDNELNYFCELMTGRGFTMHESETEGTWRVRLPESFDQLSPIFSSFTRRKTKKARKRLADAAASIQFANEDNFEMVWQQFTSLHQKRRESLGEPGCFASSEFEHFLKQATLGLMQRNLADLFVISKSGTPIGTQLLIHTGDSCMMYQSGIDPDFISEEPGYQSIIVALDHAIGRQAKFYDFLRGDESYKARWNTTREPILCRRFVPCKFSSKLKHGTWVVGRTIKDYVASFGQSTVE